MDFQRLDEDGFPVKEASPNIWDIYMREAKVYDTAMVERWKTAMEGLLIFAGLFSAAVTAFIIESYQMLQPDTGNITVDLLYQLTQQMSAIANRTQFPPSALLPPPNQISFSPGFVAIATNVLWFISLALSLACAVAATLVQQWARNYIHAIERRPSAERRALMWMYLFEGVERFKMSQLVDGVPALLHLALFSFFLGLIFFIQPISTPLTVVSIVILVLCVATYLFATFLPLFAFNSPIQTPLTSVIWQKKIIRILYKTCAHSILIFATLRLTIKHIFHPVNMIRVVLDPLWTIFDFLIRQMLRLTVKYIFHPVNMIRVVLDPLWTIFDLLIRQMLSDLQTMLKFPSRMLLRWTVLPHDLADHWSSQHVESQVLDNIRSSIANDRDNIRSQQREISAFGWLVESLDEHNELLPFIEAIPNFLSPRAFRVYDPRMTFSIVVQQPEHAREFHGRVTSLMRAYLGNARVASAYVNFYLSLNMMDWIILKEALDSSLREEIYLVQQCLLEATAFPLDLRVRTRCLRGILRSFWKSRLSPDLFQENPICPARYLSLWRAVAKHCNPVSRPEPASTIYVHDAHLALSWGMLNIVQDLTPANYKVFITFLSNLMDRLTIWCDGQSCSNYPLPREEQRLYCATISLVVSVLDVEYRYEIFIDMAYKFRKLFHLLCHMSEASSLKVVNDLLQKPMWTKELGWSLEFGFRSIVEALADRRDEEGQTCLSSDVMAKYQILRGFDPDVSILNFDGSLLRGNTVLQDLLLQKCRYSLHSLEPEKDPDTGIEKHVLLFESVFQAFYFLDDHEMLENASQVVDDFLMRCPYNEHALECKIFLMKRVAETRYEDSGVQVLIKPEQGVQTDLQ